MSKLLLVSLMLLTALACSGTPPKPDDIPTSTVENLHRIREDNATRFDDEWKGKWVEISGDIIDFEGNKPILHTGMGPGLLRDGSRMYGLEREDVIKYSKYDSITAHCTVGNYVLGSIQFNNCTLDIAPTPTPVPTATPVPTPTPAPEGQRELRPQAGPTVDFWSILRLLLLLTTVLTPILIYALRQRS